MGIQPLFSIWWVLGVGCLFVYVVLGIVQNRRSLAPLASAPVSPDEPSNPYFLPELAAAPELLSLLAGLIHNGQVVPGSPRKLTLAPAATIGQLPVELQTLVKSCYDGGRAYGSQVASFVVGAALGEQRTLLFALARTKQGVKEVVYLE